MAKKILIADDSKTMRDMVAFTLKNAGYLVVEAPDGKQAMDAFGRDRFDGVITDLNMPAMDGIALIRQIRAHPAGRAVPVLMLTTEADPKKKDEGRAAGATGWIVKPFVPEKLVEVVRKVAGA